MASDSRDTQPGPLQGFPDSRVGARARHRLLAAVYHRRPFVAARWAKRLGDLLGPDAAGDPDLAIARGWLAEQAELTARQREQARRRSVKLLVTGAPVAGATLLAAGLLAAILLWSV